MSAPEHRFGPNRVGPDGFRAGLNGYVQKSENKPQILNFSWTFGLAGQAWLQAGDGGENVCLGWPDRTYETGPIGPNF